MGRDTALCPTGIPVLFESLTLHKSIVIAWRIDLNVVQTKALAVVVLFAYS